MNECLNVEHWCLDLTIKKKKKTDSIANDDFIYFPVEDKRIHCLKHKIVMNSTICD